MNEANKNSDSPNIPKSDTPFDGLTPDRVLDAVESLGYTSDARIYPLNSYENRVYQVGIENETPLIVKFYRPNRWRDEQITEEHVYSQALQDLDIPVVPPTRLKDKTLFEYEGYRFALYERKGGHAPELDNDDNLFILGQHMGRMHALGKTKPFTERPSLTIQSSGFDSRQFLLENDFLPSTLLPAYESISEQLLEKIQSAFNSVSHDAIRLHGDCHPGNILWRDDKPNFVDLDDAKNGPAIQDLWMLLSGDRARQLIQIAVIIEGYEEFCEFQPKELKLIEALRSLRLMHYAAWLARRWHDPAFPKHFPWFNTERYWSEHILELKEQFSAMDEQPLRLMPE